MLDQFLFSHRELIYVGSLRKKVIFVALSFLVTGLTVVVPTFLSVEDFLYELWKGEILLQLSPIFSLL